MVFIFIVRKQKHRHGAVPVVYGRGDFLVDIVQNIFQAGAPQLALPQRNPREAGAVLKGAVLYFYAAVRQGKVLQRPAVVEGVASDARDVCRYFHFF